MQAPKRGPKKVCHPPRRAIRHLHGEGPEHHIGEDGGVDDHEEDSRDAAEEAREDEARELMDADIDPYCLASHHIVPDALEGAPEGGFEDEVHEEEGACPHDEDEVVGA